MAEWIPLEGLTVEPPVITPEERTKTLTGYIESSDDFLLHQEKFLTTTDTLLKEEIARPKILKSSEAGCAQSLSESSLCILSTAEV